MLDELHHIIPKFLGGLRGKKRSLYGLKKEAHQRELHDGIAALTQRHFGKHPNAGEKTFDALLTDINLNPRVIHNFRSDLYALMRQFDAKHGTALTAAFRREFQRQRQMSGFEGLFR
jgi:hypothetical protein